MLQTLNDLSGGLWPYLVVILFGFLPSEVWRVLSVYLAKGISEESEILVWVRAVASALLAGVVSKLLLVPSGALASIPISWRIAALVIGVIAGMLARRSVLVGVLVGEAVLIGAGLLL